MLPCSPFMFKNTIDRWTMVDTVCASAVISPLRLQLEKCVTRWSILFHMQYFQLLTSFVIFLYIELALVCWRNRQCSLFWDYIPDSDFFCINCQTTWWVSLDWSPWGAAKKRCSSELVKWHNIYTPEECADEWRQKKLIESYCVMNVFIIFGIMFVTASALENSPQSFDV